MFGSSLVSSPDDRDPLERLAEEFVELLRRGERPSISDYAAAHPDHAEQLRELLPAVAQMENLKRFRRTAPINSMAALPDRLGDFRIIRELGRGGMGIVFEAIQESLGRRVALKILSVHSQLDSERRARFVREAKAAARLHHTNIVPVFGVGDHDGLPYYVMQLILGRGLNSIINQWRQSSRDKTKISGSTINMKVPQESRELNRAERKPSNGELAKEANDGPNPSDWGAVARIGIQVAEALHFAHENGILHRDVKPANLLLDERSQVWVADFGLAKLIDHHGLTTSGQILGTLQYLAPECLLGLSDAKSDIYGLGATLYEMVTLEPPFEAESAPQLIKVISDSDPPTPRSLNSSIPRDLETIIMKAMAREPQRRYATAQDFANDLQAYLTDRPIQARRITAIDRSWRWCRRNPAVAILSVCTLAAILLAAGFGWRGYVVSRAALAAEKKKNDEVQEASARLEANLLLCLDAFEKVFKAAGGEELDWRRPQGRPGKAPDGPWKKEGEGSRLPGQSGFPEDGPKGPIAEEAKDKAAVLEAVLGFYDRFAEQNASEQYAGRPRLRSAAAQAHRRVGELHAWLGRNERAISSFRRATDLLKKLLSEYPDDELARSELALIYSFSPENSDWSEEELTFLIEELENMPESTLSPLLGPLYFKLGLARDRKGNAKDAAEAYQNTLKLNWPMKGEEPSPFIIFSSVRSHMQLARILTASGDLVEAKLELRRALGGFRAIATQGGFPMQIIKGPLIESHLQLAELLERTGDVAGGKTLRDEAEWIERDHGKKGDRGPPDKKKGSDIPPPRNKGGKGGGKGAL